jgi:Na+-transporting methylmalonyl-CoA/oxaloacetate decarboxylase gamma subunit
MTTTIRWRFLVSLLVVLGVLVLGVLVIGELIASFRAESRPPNESTVEQAEQATRRSVEPPSEAARTEPMPRRTTKPEETLTAEKQIDQALRESMRQADKALEALKEIEKTNEKTAQFEAQIKKMQAETKALEIQNERAEREIQATIQRLTKPKQ